MYLKFDVVSVATSLTDKKVFIEMSLDVDDATVSKSSITLCERLSGRLVDYDFVVDNKIIELTLKDWPTPNIEHLLVVQSDILAVTEEPLTAALKRSIVFTSEITSSVIVTSPSNYEEINALALTWIEKPVDKDTAPTNSYYLEVASENTFYNVVRYSTVYGKTEILLSGVPDDQYYVRVRAQDGDQYGRWSDVITFLFKDGTIPVVVEDDPIFNQDLIITMKPDNGVTPASFLIEFDEELDPSAAISVVVLRRDI